MSDEIRTLRALGKKGKLAYSMAWQQLNTSDEVAFGWQDLYQLDFLPHLPSLDFNFRPELAFITVFYIIQTWTRTQWQNSVVFWGRQWYVLKDLIDFWAAGKRALFILLFFNWKKSIMISRKSWTIFSNNAELWKTRIIYSL